MMSPSLDFHTCMITTDPSGAEIFIDDVSKGKTQNKMLTINIDIGTHKIEVKKNGFKTKGIENNSSKQFF